MRAFARLLALVVCLLPFLAKAQPYPPSPYLFLNQPNTWGAVQTFTAGIGVNNLTASAFTLNGGLAATINANPVTLASVNQPWIFTSNLTPTATSNVVYGNFESQVFVGGTAAINGEINLIHAYGQTNAGSNVLNVENIESNWVNSGSMSGFGTYSNMLIRYQNQSTGVVNETGGANLINLFMSNYNTSAGSINAFTYIQINAPDYTGGGTAPTATFGLLIKDPNAPIVSLAEVNIGSAGLPPANSWVNITDTSGNSGHNLITLNTASGVNPLLINAANDVFLSTFSTLAGGSTNGYLYVPHTATIPTTLCQFSGNGPCFVWNTATHVLDIGDNGAWYHVTAVSGAD